MMVLAHSELYKQVIDFVLHIIAFIIKYVKETDKLSSCLYNIPECVFSRGNC